MSRKFFAMCVSMVLVGGMSACQSSSTAPTPVSAALPAAPDWGAGEGETGTDALEASDWIEFLRRYPLDRIPPRALQTARDQKRELQPAAVSSAGRSQSVSGNAWRPIGPWPINFHYAPVSGRVRAVAIDESDSSLSTFYIGGAQGGIWKTYDGGNSWIPLTDSEASLATGSIAIDPDDSRIIYAGTGELGGGDSYPGAGVLRSTDGGFSWTQLGATELTGARISKVALDPTPSASPATSRIVYVASTSGLFRSLDSGATWTSVWTASTSRSFTDVVVDPVNPAIVYAARATPNRDVATPPVYRSDNFGAPGSWTAVPGVGSQIAQLGYARVNLAISHTNPPVLMASMEDARNGTDLKGIWTTADGGQTWLRVNGHPPDFAEDAFVATADVTESEPNDVLGNAQLLTLGDVVEGSLSSGTDGDFYRVQVDGNELSFEICADRVGSGFNPRLRLYLADGSEWASSPIDSAANKGVQGSNDERMSTAWTTFTPGVYYLKVESSDGTLTGDGDYQLSVIGSSLWCQCHYDQVVAVHPADTDTMYWGGIRLFRTTDGGRNWSQIQDHEQPGTGPNWLHQDIHAVAIAESDPEFMLWGTDGGVWATLDGGDKWVSLNTNLELTQFYKGIAQHPTNPGFVTGGSQDNATERLRDARWEWPKAATGDGGHTAIDPVDATQRTWYFEGQYLGLKKTTDDGATATDIVTGLGQDNVAFNAPFVLDPSNPQVLLAGGGKKTSDDPVTYEHYVYRTSTGGSSWSKNSVDLEGVINTIAIAPSDSATAFAGTTNGKVWGTTNTGVDWTDHTALPLPNRPVTDIAIHPTNTETVYVTFGSFNTGHVYRSTNGGTSWTDISSAPYSSAPLPNAPMWAIVIDPGFTNTLYVASDVGIFITTDAGVTWETFDVGLPNVAVFDLDLVVATGKMRAATHGRSMWELAEGNDACLDRDTISDGTVTGSTSGTTNDGASSCGNSSTSPDVWFLYTAPFTGELAVNTCGSSFDTVVSVHQNGCPADVASERPGGCNDDCAASLPGCGSKDSCVTVPISAGSQYLIRVAGYQGATGSYVLTVDSRRPVPGEDACGTVFLPSAGTYHGWTTTATNDGASSCGLSQSAPDVWYRYTAECTGWLDANLCNADFDTVMSVHSSCPGTVLNEAQCNDDCGGTPCSGSGSCVSFPASQGEDFHFRVAGYNGATGEFDITIACRPDNDSCTTPREVGDGATLFSNLNATTDGPDGDPLCDNHGSADLTSDIWYLYAPECDGRVTIDTCDADFDTRIAVYDGGGCPSAPSSMVCNDDACGLPYGWQSRVEFDGLERRPYLIRVGGFNGTEGQGTLTVSTSCATIFSDGFELGGTGQWSSVAP